jgi:hypothetical protein
VSGVKISPDKCLLADTAVRRCGHAREHIVNVGATFWSQPANFLRGDR